MLSLYLAFYAYFRFFIPTQLICTCTGINAKNSVCLVCCNTGGGKGGLEGRCCHPFSYSLHSFFLPRTYPQSFFFLPNRGGDFDVSGYVSSTSPDRLRKKIKNRYNRISVPDVRPPPTPRRRPQTEILCYSRRGQAQTQKRWIDPSSFAILTHPRTADPIRPPTPTEPQVITPAFKEKGEKKQQKADPVADKPVTRRRTRQRAPNAQLTCAREPQKGG